MDPIMLRFKPGNHFTLSVRNHQKRIIFHTFTVEGGKRCYGGCYPGIEVIPRSIGPCKLSSVLNAERKVVDEAVRRFNAKPSVSTTTLGKRKGDQVEDLLDYQSKKNGGCYVAKLKDGTLTTVPASATPPAKITEFNANKRQRTSK